MMTAKALSQMLERGDREKNKLRGSGGTLKLAFDLGFSFSFQQQKRCLKAKNLNFLLHLFADPGRERSRQSHDC
jgi:hypothetical protein